MSEVSWVFKMLAHPKAVQEFSVALRVIQPIMTDNKVSRGEKRETLRVLVDELSQKTFRLKPIAEQIMTIINMQEDACREYPDSESQVEGILAWLPRMKEHRSILLEEVKRHRRDYGFKE